MAATVAEHTVRLGRFGRFGRPRRFGRARRFGPVTRVRVDLHGISQFGPGDRHTLIRWEWIDVIETSAGGVVVSSSETSLTLPPGSFRLPTETLAARLNSARSIVERPDVIGALLDGLR